MKRDEERERRERVLKILKIATLNKHKRKIFFVSSLLSQIFDSFLKE